MTPNISGRPAVNTGLRYDGSPGCSYCLLPRHMLLNSKVAEWRSTDVFLHSLPSASRVTWYPGPDLKRNKVEPKPELVHPRPNWLKDPLVWLFLRAGRRRRLGVGNTMGWIYLAPSGRPCLLGTRSCGPDGRLVGETRNVTLPMIQAGHLYQPRWYRHAQRSLRCPM